PIGLNGANLVNGAATPVTVTAPIGVGNSLGLIGAGARLTFAGTFFGSGTINLGSAGDVVLATSSGGRIGSISVNSGNLNAPLESLTSLTDVTVTGGGRLQLTGTARDLALNSVRFGGFNNGGGEFTNDTDGAIHLTTAIQLAAFPVDGDIALIGGSKD